MSEYTQRFAENDIDFTILDDLTDQDLEKIGIGAARAALSIQRALAEVNRKSAAWADPTTLDLLRGIAERGALAPLNGPRHRTARVSASLGDALASPDDFAGSA